MKSLVQALKRCKSDEEMSHSMAMAAAKALGLDGDASSLLLGRSISGGIELDVALDECGLLMQDPLLLGQALQEASDMAGRQSAGSYFTPRSVMDLVLVPLLDGAEEGIAAMDPACGSGNFLVRAIELLGEKGLEPAMERMKGIEISQVSADAAILSTGLAYARHLKRNGMPFAWRPAEILVADALEVDWKEMFPYRNGIIAGNPPFLGKGRMDRNQLEQLMRIAGSRRVDYCIAWMEKASQWLTDGAYGFVVSSSACQGEQAETAWRGAFGRGQTVFSAVKDFKWSGDANVHCSAFCVGRRKDIKIGSFHDGTVEWRPAERICEYLLSVPHGTKFPIAGNGHLPSHVPRCWSGVKPIDGGNLLLSPMEKDEALAKEPLLAKWLRPCIGGRDFLHGRRRWCIWIDHDEVQEALDSSSFLREVDGRLQRFRMDVANGERLLTGKRMQFVQSSTKMFKSAICIPKTFTERHQWVPAGIVHGPCMVMDSIYFIPDASLCWLGLVVSSLHHFWMELAGGKHCADYRYSAKCVWNTFPWLSEQELDMAGKDIEDATNDLLMERKRCNASLAEIYANLPRNVELAHRKLDSVVLKAYGLPSCRDRWLEVLMARRTDANIDRFF